MRNEKSVEVSGGKILSEYLSKKQLAAELGVTVRTVTRWRWLREGPPSTLIGNRPYFHVDDVREWLRSRREVQG